MTNSIIFTANRAELHNSYSYEGKHDTFCVLILDDNRVSTRTAVNGGKYPHWNDEFQIDLCGKENKVLQIELYEAIAGSGNRLLGTGVLELSKLLENRGHGFWIPIIAEGTEIGNVIVISRSNVSNNTIITADSIKALPRVNSPAPLNKQSLEQKANDTSIKQPTTKKSSFTEIHNATQLTKQTKKSKKSTGAGIKNKIMKWCHLSKGKSSGSNQQLKLDPRKYQPIQGVESANRNSEFENETDCHSILDKGGMIPYQDDSHSYDESILALEDLTKGFGALEQIASDDEDEIEVRDAFQQYYAKDSELQTNFL